MVMVSRTIMKLPYTIQARQVLILTEMNLMTLQKLILIQQILQTTIQTMTALVTGKKLTNILLIRKILTVTMMAWKTVRKLTLELIQIIGIPMVGVLETESNGSLTEPTLSIILAMIMLLLMMTMKTV